MATVEEALAIVAEQQYVGLYTVEVHDGQVTELTVHYVPGVAAFPVDLGSTAHVEELVRGRWRWEE